MKTLNLDVVVLSESGDPEQVYTEMAGCCKEAIPIEHWTIALQDPENGKPYECLASAWELIHQMDEVYEHPMLHDLLMKVFTEGFNAGMKHAAFVASL